MWSGGWLKECRHVCACGRVCVFIGACVSDGGGGGTLGLAQHT